MFYIATLERADGQQALCNTSGSSCDFSGLPCGQTYSVTVAAEGQSCNSTQSTGPPIMTGTVNVKWMEGIFLFLFNLKVIEMTFGKTTIS